MIAVIFGIILFAFTVFSCLPKEFFGLGWSGDVLLVLKGASPVIAFIVGVFSIMVGIADVRDKREAKRDEEEARLAEEEQSRKKNVEEKQKSEKKKS